MTKESFLLYNNWAVLLLNLPDQAALELTRAICAFEVGEEYEIKDPSAKANFMSILPKLQKDREKYEDICRKRSEAAKQRKKKEEQEKEQMHANDSKCEQLHANANKCTVLLSDTETDTDTDTDNNLTVINNISPTTQNNDLNINTTTSANCRHTCREVVESYNTICKSLPKVKTLSKAREKAIKARLNTFTKEDLIHAFSLAESSRFLCGANDKNWKADFDWIIGTKGGEQHLTRILEGVYIDRRSGPQRPRAGNFVNFEQRTDDLDALVAGRIMNGTKEVNTG